MCYPQIYPTVLSASQVASLAQGSSGLPSNAISSGLFAWYSASAAAAAGGSAAGVLTDQSGNYRHGSVTSATGFSDSVLTDPPGANGIAPSCPNGIPYVSGTTATALLFGPVLPATFSYCVVSRYTSTSTAWQLRIVSSANLALGHTIGLSGVAAWNSTFATPFAQPSYIVNDLEWLLQCVAALAQSTAGSRVTRSVTNCVHDSASGKTTPLLSALSVRSSQRHTGFEHTCDSINHGPFCVPAAPAPLRRRCGTNGSPAGTEASPSSAILNFDRASASGPGAGVSLGATVTLGVNVQFIGDNLQKQFSNFAFSELMIWERTLTPTELYAASAGLAARFCLTAAPVPPPAVGLVSNAAAPVAAFSTSSDGGWRDTAAAGLTVTLVNGATATAEGLYLSNQNCFAAQGPSACEYATINGLALGGTAGISFSAWVFLFRLEQNVRLVDLGIAQGSDQTNTIFIAPSFNSQLPSLCSRFGGTTTSCVTGVAPSAPTKAGLPAGLWVHVAATVALAPGSGGAAAAAGAAAFYTFGLPSGSPGAIVPFSGAAVAFQSAFLGRSQWPADGFLDGVIGSFQARPSAPQTGAEGLMQSRLTLPPTPSPSTVSRSTPLCCPPLGWPASQLAQSI